jgi:outer membrane protein TolC
LKTKIILLSVFILAVHNLWADITLDIDSAVSRALENNLALERSRMDTLAAKRKSDRSWNSLIPSLSASALVGHPTSITDPIPDMINVWTPGFSLSASLQISPAIFATIRSTKEEYAAGRLNYEAARQDLSFQVRRLYYQLLLLQANVELMEQTAASARSRHDQAIARQRAGQASSLDELSARLDVQTQQVNLQSARTGYENAVDSLKYLLMIPPEEKIILSGSLQTYTVMVQSADDFTSNESMQMSVLRQSITTLEAQQTAAQTRSYAPALIFSWGATPMYSLSPPLYTDREWRDSNQFSIMLSLKLDNYLPWSAAKEQIDTLGDAVARQRSLLQETTMNRRNTIERLRRNILQSIQTLETIHLNITLAEETYRTYEEAYRRGTVDLQNLNNSRDSLSVAQNKLLSEQFNLAILALELEKELNIPFGSLLRWE